MGMKVSSVPQRAQASAAHASGTAEDLFTWSNGDYEGITVIVDVTAIVSTPSIVFSIEGLDPASGAYIPLLSSAAVVATGRTTLTVSPNCDTVANVSRRLALPAQGRVRATPGDADSATYSVGLWLEQAR